MQLVENYANPLNALTPWAKCTVRVTLLRCEVEKSKEPDRLENEQSQQEQQP